MKNKSVSFIIILSIIILGGCKKDNQEAPNAIITGKVVYNGQPVGLRSNGVQLELWQNGYDLFTKIPVYINQDGTFSAAVFNGNYKLTRLKGNGPWADITDTIPVQVNGTISVDVPVTPFFTISNETFSFNASDTTIGTTFNVSQVVTGKNIEKISLCIGLTQFVDITSNQIPFAPASVNDFNPPANINQPISYSISLNPNRYPDLPSPQNLNRAELRRQLGIALSTKYGFLRVGLKTVGVSERIYTAVKKIDLK